MEELFNLLMFASSACRQKSLVDSSDTICIQFAYVDQMSAAAFAKGLLDLEGQLTPILVSLVSKDSSMLDGLDTASIEMEAAKNYLFSLRGLEKETVNHLCCYNETNDNKSQISVKCDRLKHNAFSKHTSMINTSM
ncbi:hypothetical protein YC2023_051709 [Brassica napus]